MLENGFLNWSLDTSLVHPIAPSRLTFTAQMPQNTGLPRINDTDES